MTNKKNIQKTGQEMYFDEEIAKTMIGREENIEHVLTAQAVENIIMAEIEKKENLQIAEIGAGAHPQRYSDLLALLKNNGKMYWIDQAPIMLEHAKKQIPDEKIIEFIDEEMVSYLKGNKDKFDILILKYSFNYIISVSLEEWLKTMYEALKDKGIVVANLNLYEKGLKPRSFNATYTINGKPARQGYRPKHNEIIEVHFLVKGGDTSLNPETFADTKIKYYSPEKIKEATKKAGFSKITLLHDWSKNTKWLERFRKHYFAEKIKSKAMLFLRK